jgi:hypothetical protein
MRRSGVSRRGVCAGGGVPTGRGRPRRTWPRGDACGKGEGLASGGYASGVAQRVCPFP